MPTLGRIRSFTNRRTPGLVLPRSAGLHWRFGSRGWRGGQFSAAPESGR